MKYHELNIEQQDSAIDQIVEIENEWTSESEKITREDIEDEFYNGQDFDSIYVFEAIDDNTVEVSKRG